MTEQKVSSERVETGPVRFGDDWAGIFIRGDRALHYGMMLNSFSNEATGDPLRGMQVKGLADLLASCAEPCSSALSIPLPTSSAPAVSSERVSGELRDAIAAIIAGNVDESRFYNAPVFQRAATEVILALRSSVKTVGLDVADTCDGVEQEAFEAWAKAAGYDMHEHPMHYLFMNPKTDAARTGWKAGITHARQRILSALEAPTPQEAPGEVTDAMVDAAHAVIERSYQNESWEFGPPSLLARAALTAALKGGK